MSAAPVDPDATGLQAAASIPVNLPPQSDPLAAAASIPAQLPPADLLAAAASIPVNLPQPASSASNAPATADDGDGPWMKYRAAQPQPVASPTLDPWERPSPPSAQPVATAPAAEGPWTKYQAADPPAAAPNFFDKFDPPAAAPADEGPWTKYQRPPAPEVTRDPWERPAQPVATAQAQPAQTWGEWFWGKPLEDPRPNATIAYSAAAIGRTADNAVRNVVDGITRMGRQGRSGARRFDRPRARLFDRTRPRAGAVGAGYERKSRGHRDRRANRGHGVAGRRDRQRRCGPWRRGESYSLSRSRPRVAVRSSDRGTVGGVNAAGNDQDPVTGAILGAGAGAAGSTLARGVGALARAAMPSTVAAAPSTQALKDTAQAAYAQAFQPGVVGQFELQVRAESDH